MWIAPVWPVGSLLVGFLRAWGARGRGSSMRSRENGIRVVRGCYEGGKNS